MESMFVCFEDVVDLRLNVHAHYTSGHVAVDVDAQKRFDRLPRDGRGVLFAVITCLREALHQSVMKVFDGCSVVACYDEVVDF